MTVKFPETKEEKRQFEKFCKLAQYDPDFGMYFIISKGHKLTSDDTYDLRMKFEKQEKLGWTKYPLNIKPPKEENEE